MVSIREGFFLGYDRHYLGFFRKICSFKDVKSRLLSIFFWRENARGGERITCSDLFATREQSE